MTIRTFLEEGRWKPYRDPTGQLHFTSPDSEYRVSLGRDTYRTVGMPARSDDTEEWNLGRFTDSDIETEWGLVAKGRYETVLSGEGIAELEHAMISLAIHPDFDVIMDCQMDALLDKRQEPERP